jgi:eukaryotic-like serine/threonine-protein kinase
MDVLQLDEEAIFHVARRMAPGEARAAHLDQACGGDRGLRGRLDVLLRVHDLGASFLESPALIPLATMTAAGHTPPPEGPGAVIGPYKLLEPIGEGGMGVVYMAEQTQPVRRKVALKLIKPGMDSRQVVARFDAERQALALMDHPNIARVLDAGTTGSGRPYFVMELVRGIPVTDYCDREQLSIPERVELFVLVCRAVQHAHQKGIIHRDIKPSNVLITLHDGVPVPKVIDFGIAKATGQSLTDKTLDTGHMQLVGTPLYMSPEQAEMNGLDVDTRSDIYSLGVLLYELLTGTTPFDQDTFRTAALDEMRRIIREEELPRPSTRLSTLGATLATVSINRNVDPGGLGRSVRGELDWIVMRALEKDRRRRYETANDFAADLNRYLTDQPVEAGPPSPWYRFTKFTRRNRAALTTTALIAVVLVGGTVVSTWQALRARAAERTTTAALERARDSSSAAQAQRVLAEERFEFARQAVDEMYTEFAEDWLSQRDTPTPVQRDFLRKALAFYQRFATEPGQDLEALHKALHASGRVAEIHRKLAQHDEAERACRISLELAGQLTRQTPDRPELLRDQSNAYLALGDTLFALKRTDEAESVMREGLALQESVTRRFPTVENRLSLASQIGGLAQLLDLTGRPLEAEALLRKSLTTFEELAPEYAEQDRFKASSSSNLSTLGSLLVRTGRNDEADAVFQRCLDLIETLYSAHRNDPGLRFSLFALLMNRSAAQHSLDRLQHAEATSRRALGVIEGLIEDYPAMPTYRVKLAGLLDNQSRLLDDLGRTAEANAAFERARSIMIKLTVAFPDRSEFREELKEIETRRALSAVASIGRERPDRSRRETLAPITKGGKAPWVSVTDSSRANLEDRGNVVAIDSQGRPVSIGTISTLVPENSYQSNLFSAIRYRPDGTLDTSFNGNGLISVTNTGLGATGLLQPDQKIVIGGRDQAGRMTLARVNPDGSPDSSFGMAGVVTTAIGSTTNKAFAASQVQCVALDAQSRIVVAGILGAPTSGRYQSEILVARYTSWGTLDESFGSRGYTTLALTDQSEYPCAVLLLPDGKILLSGFTLADNTSLLARFNADGTLDKSFGTGGVIVAHLPGSANDKIHDLALDRWGKIVAIASFSATSGGAQQPMVLRYNIDGTLDTTFNGTGYTTVPTPALPGGYGGGGLALYTAADSSQKIVVGLRAMTWQPTADFGLAQLNADGTPDTSFGGTGVVFKDLNDGQMDQLRGIAVAQLADGPRIYATGIAQKASVDTIMARFRVDGTLDAPR